jgi:hypothetical protein
MRRPAIGQATAQRDMNTLYQNAHSSERDAANVLQYLDVAFVLIGAIAALIIGAPAFGVIVGAAGWLLQRLLQVIDRRLTARIEDSLRRAGVRSAEAFGRIWLLVGAIVVAGAVGGRKDGLAAALLIFAAYSIGCAIRLANGQPPGSELDR